VDLAEVTGLAVFAAAVIVAGWTSALTIRFRRQGSLVEAMVQVTFLPEKRRTYLHILSIEGSLILLASLLWSLSVLGIVPAWLGDVLLAACLIGAVASVGAITSLGLRPRGLSAEDRIELRDHVPEMLQSIAFAAYSDRGSDESSP
jgi:hypothetical protein